MSLSMATLWSSALTFNLPLEIVATPTSQFAAVQFAASPKRSLLTITPGKNLEKAVLGVKDFADIEQSVPSASIALTVTPAAQLLSAQAPLSQLSLAGWFGDIWCDGYISIYSEQGALQVLSLASHPFSAILHAVPKRFSPAPEPPSSWLLASLTQGLTAFFASPSTLELVATPRDAPGPADALFWVLLRRAFPTRSIFVAALPTLLKAEPRWKRLWQNCAIQTIDRAASNYDLSDFPWEGWLGGDSALINDLALQINQRSPVIPELLLRP